MARWLGWLGAVLVAVGLILWLTAPPTATLWVQSNGVAPGSARCPRGTLEDHGACVPVPAPKATDDEALIPRLPGRPERLDAYELPAGAAAEVISWSMAPLPQHLLSSGPGLAIRPAEPTELPSEWLVALGARRVVAVSPDEGWVMLWQEPGPSERLPVLLLLGGLTSVAETIRPGLMLSEESPPIGSLRGTLWLAARQLRPESASDAGVPRSDAWGDLTSVPLDPRNVLVPKASP